MQTVSDSTAFITGGASGIGLATARAFAAEGARLALADLDGEALKAARSELEGQTEVMTFQLDVGAREAMSAAADAIEQQLGPVRILCNNAGIGSGLLGGLDGMSYAKWDAVLGVNLGGVVNGLQTFLPRMIAQGGPGHVVNTSSAAGLVTSDGTQFMYNAAKYAVTGLSEALAKQLEAAGIGTTVVFPGLVRTNIIETSRDLSPGDATTSPDGEASDRAAAQSQVMLNEYGLDPDTVGAMILEAIHADQLYLPTDRLVAEPLAARTAAVLDAMPLQTDLDRRVAELVQAHERRPSP